MAVKLLLLILSFSLNCLSQSFADEPSLCEDAGAAICNFDVVPSAPGEVAKQIRTSAISEVNRFLGLHLTESQFLQSLRDGMKRRENDIYRKHVLLYLSCADYLARARFSGVTPHACFKGTSRSLSGMQSAIDRLDAEDFPKSQQVLDRARALVIQAVQNARFSPELKADLTHELMSLEHESLSEGIDGSIDDAMASGNATPDSIAQQAEQCSFDLFEVNAFRRFESFIICPSVWIDAMESTTSSNEGILLSALTHEIGHVIGGRVAFDPIAHPNTPLATETGNDMNQILSCLGTDVNAQLLKLNLPEFDSPSERATFVNRLGSPSSLQIAKLFYQEYAADSVSAEAMALYFESLPASVDRGALLRRNLRTLCGTDSDTDEAVQDASLNNVSLHPSTLYRIRTAYLGNPHLRETLGCGTIQKIGCSVFPR